MERFKTTTHEHQRQTKIQRYIWGGDSDCLFNTKIMIRFVEIKGIYCYEEDQIKDIAFGFFNTITDKFITLSGTQAFEDLNDFELWYDKNDFPDKERLLKLIPQEWKNKKIEL